MTFRLIFLILTVFVAFCSSASPTIAFLDEKDTDQKQIKGSDIENNLCSWEAGGCTDYGCYKAGGFCNASCACQRRFEISNAETSENINIEAITNMNENEEKYLQNECRKKGEYCIGANCCIGPCHWLICQR